MTRKRSLGVALAAVAILVALSGSAHAVGVPGLGVVAGAETGADEFFLGAQGEFGPVVGFSYLVPSLYVDFGDANTATANLDLRWYLLHLPETGIHIYGAAGPTVVFANDTEIGLSLTAGFNIPMKSQRRYNLEFRFGLGDIPDFRIAAAVMFGL
jgi:hypothetical protein